MHTPMSQEKSSPANKASGKSSSARILGFYLISAGVCEIGIYYSYRFPVLLMPRRGVADLLGELKLHGDLPLLLAEILSACWLFALGAFLIYGKRPLKTYLATELLPSTPTLRIAASLLVSGGGHFAGRAEGVYMLMVLVVFTFIPILLAIRAPVEG